LIDGRREVQVVHAPAGFFLEQQVPTKLRSVVAGLAFGWSMALLLAIACVLSRRTMTVLLSMAISGSLLSAPSAVLATVCLVLDFPTAAALAAVIFPRVFPHVYEQLRAGQAKPHVLMARSRGLSGSRVFFFHVVPSAVMPILAVAGVSVSLALGASVPIEALADSPGLGQLAWRAALGRDLPILVSITLLLTAVTVSANAVVDIVTLRLARAAP
jgi:peptide/nickel transport system permease protein